MSKLRKNRRFEMERLEDRQLMAADFAADLLGDSPAAAAIGNGVNETVQVSFLPALQSGRDAYRPALRDSHVAVGLPGDDAFFIPHSAWDPEKTIILPKIDVLPLPLDFGMQLTSNAVVAEAPAASFTQMSLASAVQNSREADRSQILTSASSGGVLNLLPRTPTGDVTATMIGSTVFLNEPFLQAGGSNSVAVIQVDVNTIRILGSQNAFGAFSKVNGKSFVDFTFPGGVPGNLVVNFGDGPDKVVFGNNVKLNDLNVNLGAATASFNDMDVIDVRGLTTRGAVQIDTGPGSDIVTMKNFTIGDGVGFDNLLVRTGSGVDYVGIGSTDSWNSVRGHVTVKTYNLASEIDNDVVSMQLTNAYKQVFFDLGGGNDVVEMLAVAVADDLLIVGGDGADAARLREVQVHDGFFSALGAGNDTLDLDYVRARSMSLDGGGDVDRLTMSSDSYAQTSSRTNWEFINGRPLFMIQPLVPNLKLGS